MSFSDQVKSSLLDIISEMAAHPQDFSKHPKSDFSMNRKLDFSTLLQLIISMEAGSVKDELLKFFSYDKSTASNSAFFQQRDKLTDRALPYLFHTFNSVYPCTLYKGRYQLLAADGSSFTFTRNPLDTDSYFAPNGKTTNGYNQVHVIPLFDLLSKRYTNCVVQPTCSASLQWIFPQVRTLSISRSTASLPGRIRKNVFIRNCQINTICFLLQ